MHAAEAIITAVRGLANRRVEPVVAALDGPSGCGKSTLAGIVAEALGATVVPADDFFAANITDARGMRKARVNAPLTPASPRATGVLVAEPYEHLATARAFNVHVRRLVLTRGEYM